MSFFLLIGQAFFLYVLCGYPGSTATAPYSRAETVQITWTLNSEDPIRARALLRLFHQPSGEA